MSAAATEDAIDQSMILNHGRMWKLDLAQCPLSQLLDHGYRRIMRIGLERFNTGLHFLFSGPFLYETCDDMAGN